MNCVIKNHKNVFIRLSENGRPVTCSEKQKELFERPKAKNILNSLPKTLQRLHFRIEDIPDIKPPQKDIKKYNIVPDNVKIWVDKFGSCEDVLSEAKERIKFLIGELKKVDDEILDVLHIIEIENSKDLYGGWTEYKRIKNNREKRRKIKDEILIIDNVLRRINPYYLKRETVQKAIDGLLSRKYKFRIIEEESGNETLLQDVENY